MLPREGFAVEVAFDSNQALAEFGRRSYDLVLSDVRMPDLDGRRCCAPTAKRLTCFGRTGDLHYRRHCWPRREVGPR